MNIVPTLKENNQKYWASESSNDVVNSDLKKILEKIYDASNSGKQCVLIPVDELPTYVIYNMFGYTTINLTIDSDVVKYRHDRFINELKELGLTHFNDYDRYQKFLGLLFSWY